MKHFENHIAVWMDHQKAHLIFPKGKEDYSIQTIDSTLDTHPRVDGGEATGTTFGKNRESNNEYNKHNRENEELQEYYKTLQRLLAKYDEILLFGPTKAKVEFFNILFVNKAFSGKRISMESAEKLSEKQMVAFVKDFFGEGVKRSLPI